MLNRSLRSFAAIPAVLALLAASACSDSPTRSADVPSARRSLSADSTKWGGGATTTNSESWEGTPCTGTEVIPPATGAVCKDGTWQRGGGMGSGN